MLKYSLYHETIIRTGITCKKIPICATQLAGGLLLKMLKCFDVKHF